jgi:RNA polymerase sigma-70 factor (ECF subfamily)
MSSPENEVREEIALLAATGRGERAAFRELYTRYSASLLALAMRFVGDQGAAEEVLQDAFMKIWQHAATYDARLSRPFTWAVTIVRRTAIDHLRKHRRAPVLQVLPDLDAPGAPGELSLRETARSTAEAHETAERVHTILTTIAPPQRDALELALFSTLTHAEIAARLAQPVGTVKTWIRRGLLQLRTSLNSATS